MTRSVALAHLVRLENGLSEGIWAGHTLRSAFQPIYSFRGESLEITAYEGLLRAFRGDEAIPPMAFFSGIPAFDRMHVETLTRTLHLLNAAACLEEDASVFVNFDPSVFTDRSVAETALRDMRLVLHEAGLDSGRVVCEVTEQRSASPEALVGFIEALRASGFRIAVDDYGSDDSDIVRVTELKPDIVKFDAQWIARLMDTDPGYSLLSMMVASFEERGIATVFEGIEEAWQIDLAAQAGVSMLQGYALARPELAVIHRGRALQSLHLGHSALAEPDLPSPPPARVTHKPERIFGKRVL